MWRCRVDDVFTVYCAATWNAFENYPIVDYGLFCDYTAELPLFFFKSLYEALQYTERNTNRYPIDRQQYWLRFHDNLWFSTVAIEYLDYLKYIKSELYLNNLINVTARQN